MLGDVELLTLPAYARVGHGIGYMPEDRRLVPEFTVEENIRLPTWTTETEGVEKRLKWILSIMPEIEVFRGRRALELSGGQQKMVALARALMAGAAHPAARRAVRGPGPGAGAPARRGDGEPQGRGRVDPDRRSNEIHVADLLSRAFRIERGAVAAV